MPTATPMPPPEPLGGPPLISPKPQGGGMLLGLRNSLLTGIVVTTPVALTVWLVFSLVTFVDARVKPYIPEQYNPETYVRQLHPFLGEVAIPGLGLIVVLGSVAMIGALARNFFGRALIRLGESIVDRLPIVRTVYSVLKQIVETVLAQQGRSFDKVVLVQYPRPGLWGVGFTTSDARGEIGAKLGAQGGSDWVSIFVPTSPNPTTGFLLYVRRSELIVLDMPPDQGAKLVVSIGIVAAPNGEAAAQAIGATVIPEARARDPMPDTIPEAPGAANIMAHGRPELGRAETSAGAEERDGAVAVEEIQKQS